MTENSGLPVEKNILMDSWLDNNQNPACPRQELSTTHIYLYIYVYIYVYMNIYGTWVY